MMKLLMQKNEEMKKMEIILVVKFICLIVI